MIDSTKLLLVDDDGLVLSTMGKGLEQAGYQVALANNGKQALELAEEDEPDLVILDVRMPEMSGFEAAQALKKMGIPAIFLSAYNDDEYVKQALAEDAMGYLVKPIDVDKAIPMIEAALERARDLSQLREETQRLDNALQTGNQVNVAVGIMMERNKLDRQSAYELIRGKARSEQRKVKEVAIEILEAWNKINDI
ncbi:MAG: response regulator [Gammaproteobacteria bacterium]|nr:response regulator [Gammaproteobacteria bacterium]